MYLSCLKERQREKRQDVFIPEDCESDNDEEEYKEIDDSYVRRKEGKVQLKINKYGELSNIEQIIHLAGPRKRCKFMWQSTMLTEGCSQGVIIISVDETSYFSNGVLSKGICIYW